MFFPNQDERYRKRIFQRVDAMLATHTGSGADIAGFAFAVWDSGLGITCDVENMPHSHIPSAALPEFIKNGLLLDKAVRWTRDD